MMIRAMIPGARPDEAAALEWPKLGCVAEYGGGSLRSWWNSGCVAL